MTDNASAASASDTSGPTPVFLLTGFLGSGKSTLLAALMRLPTLADTAIIVNEFGEVGIDHRLVARGEEESIVLLENGCLCCSAGDSLGETLLDLFYRRARQEIPYFSRVIIETSGMADPGAILATLLADRFMMGKYQLAGIIATIDAEHGRATAGTYAEAATQLALADRLVITKVDRVNAEAVTALKDWLRGQNPRASLMTASHGEGDILPLIADMPATRDMSMLAGDGLVHDHAQHSSGIATIFVPIDTPISWAAYAALVTRLQAEGDQLLRTKGLIRLAGEDGLFAVQGVRRLFAPPTRLPEKSEADVRTGLVLIGPGVGQPPLRAALADILSA